MSDLDRLGWAAGTSFVSYGARIGIRVTDPAILGRLQAHLPPGWEPSASEVDDLYSLVVGPTKRGSRLRNYHLLYQGVDRLARTLDIDEVLHTLESWLHFTVALKAQPWLFVHAGVVGWRGQAIVIPGRSMTGKSTLVEALVRAGATYYSDEYAVFDAEGRVHPYPKPLTLKRRDPAGKRQCSVEELGGRVGSEPLPVAHIVATAYRPGARWRPRVLSGGPAALTLLDNTVVARSQPAFALAVVKRATARAILLKGRRGDVQEVVGPLLRRVGPDHSQQLERGS